MSAPSPATNQAKQDWLSALSTEYAGDERDALRHTMLLQRCFDGHEMRWSDALVARARRHIGGCLTSVEIALRLELGAAVEPHLRALPDPLCWARVQQAPALIGPALIGHMRDRAAIGLMGQDHAFGDGVESEGAPFAGDAQQTLTAIMLGQSGWADAGQDDRPMRADLPAEAMQELVWTVGAVFVDALIKEGGEAGQSSALAMQIDQACSIVLTRHDEHYTPYAQAALFAHRIRGADISESQLLYLMRHRHVLALLGVAADRLAINMPCLVRHVVEGSEQALFTLCRAAQFPREVAVRLVLGRRSVARGVDDSVLVQYADAYDDMTLAEARGAVAVLGLSQPMRARLALVRAGRAQHGV